MTAILGIDPGCSGALVLVTEQGGYIDHLPMPTIKVGTKSRVNGAAVAAWLRQYGITHAYLEQVGAMPGQGTASMFTFGHAAGVAEGILQGLNIPYTLVTPQAWKKSAGLIGSDKDAARSRAIQLYPELRALDAKAKGQAIADALLIARHGIGVK
ncbi:crossover junction endodeoxyribonuclease RuvC [Enterobacter kobei]|uniref:crossover junction endodeoxyribonuclease RuvC n=1 Tax=Enterobacter kobei TaxID=208224 RepID=UPI002075E553|nr:crossover junction endodeoxyribonuclease RuvC [Enterobacter kobei]MCM7802345.1 crossover junction endodeoxyribonuclease RuvC [Enterobacter kobei]